jgi:hypothetical protein
VVAGTPSNLAPQAPEGRYGAKAESVRYTLSKPANTILSAPTGASNELALRAGVQPREAASLR